MHLVGHERAMDRLRHAAISGRVAPCYLLVGPDGIGKTSLARWFAQVLSCVEPERPCGRCARCKRLAEGTCPDLTVFEEASHPATLDRNRFPGRSAEELDTALGALVSAGLLTARPRGLGRARVCSMAGPDCNSTDPEAEISAALKDHEPGSLAVELARLLFLRGAAVRYPRSLKIELVRRYVLRQVSLRPVEMSFRVFLLDDAHTMPVEAQNALLKTLEEPPPSSVLVLVTSRPSQILPTIVSRCQNVVLRGLGMADLCSVLEGFGASAEDAALSAELAHGSVLKALDFDVAEHRRRRNELLEALEPEGERSERVGALVRALSAGGGPDRQDRHRQVEAGAGLLLELVRDALMLASGASEGVLRHREARERIERLSRIGAGPLTRVSEVVLDLKERLATNASVDLQALAFGSRLIEALSETSLPRPRRP
jgi:DNA polymerase III delta prime subunit